MKLTLTTKLLLPSLIVWGILYSAFNFFWIPKYIETEKISYIKQIKEQLQLLAESTINPLSYSDLGDIYSAFDNVSRNRPAWSDLRLLDEHNKQIYPLEKIEEKSQKKLIKINYYYNLPNEIPVAIKLKVDPSELYNTENTLISEFRLLFLILFSIAVSSSYIIQKQLVVAPVNKLLDATKKIAKQDFSVVISQNSSDAIGTLTNSFNLMKLDLHNYQEQLKHAINKAEESLKVKSQFLANMSHELKTPLNIILGHCQLMEINAKQNRPTDIEDIQSIYQATRHLTKLIEDLLIMSKIGSNKISLHLESFNLNDLIDEIASSFLPLINQKQNRINTRYDNNINKIFCDKTKIRNILYNLINNANKFTDKGNITVETSALEIDGISYFMVSVSDTGIGISNEKQKIIFKPFVQIDSSLNKKYEGTGLGLSLSEELCALMHGNLNVQSEPEKGSKFSFYLPVNLENMLDKTEYRNHPDNLNLGASV